MRNFKIYTLSHPTTNEIKYIGVTCGTLSNRLSQHIWTARERNNSYIHKWINLLIKNNLRPIIKEIDCGNEDSWKDLEKYWIKFYREKGYKLCNITNGGDSVVINREFSGKERTRRAKFKPIYQCDLDFNIIKEWESACIAGDSIGCSPTNINKCAVQQRNSNPTACGFRWVYKDLYDSDNYIKKPKKDKKERKYSININEIDIQGNILNMFANVEEACNFYLITRRIMDNRIKHSTNNIFNLDEKIFTWKKVT